MKMSNKIRTKYGPWGSPLATNLQVDFMPVITPLWSGSLGRFHLTLYSASPYFITFCRGILWKTVAKAFLMSRQKIATALPWSTMTVISSQKAMRWFERDLPFVNHVDYFSSPSCPSHAQQWSPGPAAPSYSQGLRQGWPACRSLAPSWRWEQHLLCSSLWAPFPVTMINQRLSQVDQRLLRVLNRL